MMRVGASSCQYIVLADVCYRLPRQAVNGDDKGIGNEDGYFASEFLYCICLYVGLSEAHPEYDKSMFFERLEFG